MTTYRVYYAERMPRGARDWMRVHGWRQAGGEPEEMQHEEVEWEEEVEAGSAAQALEAFFREHVRDRAEVRWLDELGESHELQGIEDYAPDKGYIWIEDDKLMEYQGMDETTPGMATCPLCAGQGEVVAEVAEEFLARQDAEDEEEGRF